MTGTKAGGVTVAITSHLTRRYVHPAPAHFSYFMLFRFLLFLLVALPLAGCDNEDPYESSPQPDSVRYVVKFEALWSSSTHPTAYPAGAHFSRLIGCAHHSAFSLFTEGQPATTGIKDMAERGLAVPLRDELLALQASGAVGEVRAGDVGFPSPGFLSDTITLSKSHPQASYCTMVAPSPDWFAAVRGVTLYPNQQWKDQLTVDAGIYDAGTDSGSDFNSLNQASTPVEPVHLISTAPLAVNGSVPLMARVTFTRLP
jgi:predicted heme/steroid binding protein